MNEEEAARVRAIFDLYLEHGSLIATIRELDARGWTNKRWTTKKGHVAGGAPFNKHGLHSLLTNVLYTGRITYKDEVHDGEHPAIVDPEVFQRAQELLKRNHLTGGAEVRNRFGAILKGLLRCVPCDAAMVPTHTTRNGTKRYRYYVCSNAQKRGWHVCPSKSIPAPGDRAVRGGPDPVHRQGHRPPGRHPGGRRGPRPRRGSGTWRRRGRAWSGTSGATTPSSGSWRGSSPRNGTATDRVADLQDRIRAAEQRSTQVREELIALGRNLVDEKEVARVLAVFDPVWESPDPAGAGPGGPAPGPAGGL